MRSTRVRRAAMIGSAALLLVAPCATLAQAEPAPPATALPEDLVAAIQRDLKLSPDQYLDRANTGQELATFADTLRGKFPTTFAGAWLDAAGAPLVGLADGPDKAAARTAVEAAGYQVKDQPRSELALNDLLGQLNNWVQQLPAPLAGLVNGTAINTVNNDIALGVKDTAAGQGLQLPDFLSFVRVVKGPADTSELPGLGSLGSSGSSDPTKPTEPTDPTGPTDTTVALDPVTGATVGKKITLKAKVKPAAAGGTVEFKDGDDVLGTGQVGANGEATYQWTPATDGQRTITATFSGRDGVTGSTTTRQVSVAKAGSNTVASTTTLDPVKEATVGKAIKLKAKVTPAAAGGTVYFEVLVNSSLRQNEIPVGADGTATWEWTPETAGPANVYALFSGRDGVDGSTTTTQEFTVAPTKPKPPARDAIMGGDAFDFVDAFHESHMCSLAFNGTDAAGHAVVLTAGHCDPNDPVAAGTPDASTGHEMVGGASGERGERFGAATKTDKGKLDHSVIKIDDKFAKRFENNYVRIPGKAPLAITGVATPMVGQPVCKSGWRTGYRCGTVISTDDSRFGNDNRGKVVSDICALGGDSGGAVFTGTMALGLVSQNNGFESQEQCDAMNTEEGIGEFNKPKLFSTPIVAILKADPGLKIRTN